MHLTKLDFIPILSAGRHEMSLPDFEEKFIISFQGDAKNTREKIWQTMMSEIISKILIFDIKCELWLDGSFITQCDKPNDIDGSLMVPAEAISTLSDEAISFLEQFDDYEPSFDPCIDVYLCQVYPRDHPSRGEMNDPDGWAKQWSSEHNSGWLKGFAVIPFR